MKGEVESLKKVVEERPTPAAFAQLAEIYKDLQDEETALRYCRQAISKFPNDDSFYRIIGELRLRRYYKDFFAKDGKIAIENLEKACELNNRNYKALTALGGLYLKINALSKARQKLKNILLFAPQDEEVKALFESSNKMSKPPHEDIDILLQTVEEEHKGKSLATHIDPSVFQVPLESLKKADGLLCLLICDREGNLIVHYAQEGVDFNTYYEVGSSIYQTVQNSSLQMDMGRLQKCQVDGAFGNIQIIAGEGAIYIAFGSPTTKAEQIYKHIQRLISTISLQQKQGTVS